MRRRLSRLPLTTTFGVVSLVALLGLGVLVAVALSHALREKSIEEGTRTAGIVTHLALEQAELTDGRGALPDRLTRPQVRAVDDAVARSRPAVRDLRLWSADDGTIYSSSSQVDEPSPDRPEFAAARDGRTTAYVDASSEEARSGALLKVFHPVLDRTGEVVGVAQVSLPFSSPTSLVDSSARTLIAVVLLAIVLVWALLFNLLGRMSRTLREQSEQNARLALHDPLTGLANRRMLNERLERAALLSSRTGSRVALMLLDVDRFKEVNDTLGHDHGDRLLCQVSERLQRTVRDMDTVARLGGDEFAILLPVVGSVEDAEQLGRRVLSVFDEPFELDELALHVDASIGLVVIPDHADDHTKVLQRADVAMYVAKAAHIGMATYSSEEDAHNTQRLVLLGDLRRALDDDEQLEVFFQPKVNLRSGEVVGLEALLRWHHPVHGLVGPEDFVPLAERTGLIHPLTRRVLTLVIEQLAEWDRQGREMPVAVNLSARNLNEPRLVDFIADLLDRHGVHPVLLELEVTESAVIDDPVGAHRMLNRLSSLGLQIAVDDFGVGYTSMAQLEQMPLRALKIDRSFVWRMLEDPGGAVLVKAIIDLAHEFNLLVVAEGVEQEPMLAELRRLGCDVAQGFHWSEPVPAGEIHDVLDRICVARGRENGRLVESPVIEPV